MHPYCIYIDTTSSYNISLNIIEEHEKHDGTVIWRFLKTDTEEYKCIMESDVV